LTKPGDLPAEELKALITNGGLDILLAGVGYAGVKLAPKFAKLGDDALKLTDDIAKKFDDAYQATKGKVADLANKVDDALSPGMVTTEGITIKPSQIDKLQKLSQPKKIVSVDSNGKPSGTRFRDDYDTHIKEREFTKASQKTGVNGAHNLDELEKYAIKSGGVQTKESINVISKTPHPTVKGIYKVEYQMPKLDVKGKPTGLWRNKTGTTPFEKTVYDPKVISYKQMLQWGREAFANAVKNGFSGNSGNKWRGTASNGLKFEGFIDKQGTITPIRKGF
jgi:hypothetical protein